MIPARPVQRPTLVARRGVAAPMTVGGTLAAWTRRPSPPAGSCARSCSPIGTELTVGETHGHEQRRAGAVARGPRRDRAPGRGPARRPSRSSWTRCATALARADLVVTTGGLGPTPDDLTREAVAELCGETRSRSTRRPSPGSRGCGRAGGSRSRRSTVKQAWLIPSATRLPNPNGTAPGWWVDRPDGRVIVTLPGPPREMRPMWAGRSAAAARGPRGRGRPRRPHAAAHRHRRVAGRRAAGRADPAGDQPGRRDLCARRGGRRPDLAPATADGRSAAALADEAEAAVVAILGEHVWARGTTTWARALDEALAARGLDARDDGARHGRRAGRSCSALPARVRRAAERRRPAAPTRRDEGVGHVEVRDGRRASAMRRAPTSGCALRALAGGEDTPVPSASRPPDGTHAERRSCSCAAAWARIGRRSPAPRRCSRSCGAPRRG